MTDLPDSIGGMTVTGRLVSGLADSIDASAKPDMRPNAGTVTFDVVDERGSVYAKPISVPSEKLLLTLVDITAGLNADGDLVAPDDGEGATDDDLQVPLGVVLVAPNQAGFATLGLRWKATVRPAAGQRWSPFSIIFTGAPGDELDLSDAALVAATTSLAQQPVVWSQHGTAIPAGARPGQFIYDEDTGNFYLIGSI